MVRVLVYIVIFLLYLHGFGIDCLLSIDHENIIDSKVLTAGEELQWEKLPLLLGSRLYLLRGLKPSRWYEVKISYPASIPASFSIQLKRGKVDYALNWKRRLLNTEKLIFKVDSLDMLNPEGEMYVLVIVEPAGIVAMPHGQERQFVIFNIVCDELLFGIPHKAWWVGILVFICLGLALVIPYFLQSRLLQKTRSLQSGNQTLCKDS